MRSTKLSEIWSGRVKLRPLVVAAIARKVAAFLWAIGHAVAPASATPTKTRPHRPGGGAAVRNSRR